MMNQALAKQIAEPEDHEISLNLSLNGPHPSFSIPSCSGFGKQKKQDGDGQYEYIEPDSLEYLHFVKGATKLG